MKRTIIGIFVLLFVATFNEVFAQHDNLINSSAEWVRTPARNAATDAGDIVIYNPAGTVKLSDGFHINIGNQSLFRKPTHSWDLGMGEGEKTATQSGNDAVLPNFYATYKSGSWALFTGIFIAGGGATANYPSGSINTDLVGLQALMAAQGAYGATKGQYLKASSMYLTSTMGIAYSLSDKISMAIAGRYLDAKNTTKAGVTLTSSPLGLDDAPLELNTEDKATGFGGVISMMYDVSPRFRTTLRYETAVDLNFETTQVKDDLGVTTNGAKSHRDLPAVLAWGGSYAVSSSICLYGDVNYYFQKNADWEEYSNGTTIENYSDLAGDAVSLNLAATFNISPKFMWSTGGGYTDFKYSDKEGYFTKTGAFETIPTDNWNINSGITIKTCKTANVTLGYMHTFYSSEDVKAQLATPLDVTVHTKNSLDALAIGIDLTF
jgi:long-chain fatty acid transport protein